MQRVLGEDIQLACDTEITLANLLAEHRLLIRLNMQTQLFDKYWNSGTLEIEIQTYLLHGKADICCRLGQFQHEATFTRVHHCFDQSSKRLRSTVCVGCSETFLALYELGQFAEVEENLGLLN